MSRTAHLGLALLLAGLAVPASAQQTQTDFTAYLSRNVKPNSGERLGFHLWGASSVEVEEYRLNAAQLEAALRPNGLRIDTSPLTPRRTETFSGWQGDIAINARPGVYVYVARSQGGSGVRNQAQAVVVSDLSVGVKRDDESSLVMINRGTQLARNVGLKIYESATPDSAPSLLRDVNVRAGVGYYWSRSTESLIYVARKGRHVAIQNGYDRSWTSASPWQAHVQTDRPLYRPGQEVHYKVVLREKVNGAHRTPVAEDVSVFLRDSQGSRIRIGTEQTNAYGSISGSYNVAEEASLGNYVLEVEAGQASPSGSRVVGSVGFGIEKYRKPEYKVEVETEQPTYIQGDTIRATISADFYFGAPVPGAQVTYTVKKRTRYRWWNPWIRPMVFAAIEPGIWWPHWGSDSVVTRGTATTGNDGKARIAFAADQDSTADSDYTIEAKVVDASNREVSGSAKVPVTRAAFDVILVTDRWVYEPGDIVNLRVNLADANGAAAVAPIDLKIDAVESDGTKNTRFTRTVTPSSDGTYSIRLRATNPNHYVISATATDADGNQVSTSRTIWVADDSGGRDWSTPQVEIIADKDTYEPGDQARFLIRAPVALGSGLITLESTEIKSVYMFDIVGGMGVINLPIAATMSPNVFVSVMVPGADGITTASKELQVPPTDKMITVQVTADKAEYEPGDDATFRLKATDANGNPVQAEVSLGIVDEALYALREDGTAKLNQTFFPKEWNRVHTLGARGGGFGGGIGGPIFMRAMSTTAAPEAANAADDSKRTFFPDTLRWIADVETDQNGEAVVTQKMADSLTTWRLTARAVTKDTEVGQTQTRVLVSKDLIVRLATPRTMVEGDEMTLVGIVHNLAEDGTAGAFPDARVNVTLAATNLTLLDNANQTVIVPAHGQATVSWRVKVDKAGEATIDIAGVASFERDALQLKVPVAVRGVAAPEVQAGSMLQDGSTTFDLEKKAGAIDEASSLEITLSPSLAGTMLDSVDYLVGYPYGCIEQTMSKFLPTLMVHETLRLTGREDPQLRDELPKMVKKGVERLQGLQNPDGGFGWFGGRGGTSHPYVSAYATYGLALARREGHDVPSELLDKAIAFLKSSLDDPANTDDTGRAYQCFALAMANAPRAADMRDLAQRRAQLGNYARAVLAIALKESGDASLASDVVGSLVGDVQQASGRAWFEGDTLRYGSWSSNTVETTAYALWALIEVDPNNALVADTMAWLLSRRRTGGRYTTTKDTAAVLLTFARYVQITGELRPDLTVKASVNGVEVGAVQFTASDLGKKAVTLSVPGSALNTGANTVTIERQGQGALYYTAVLDQHVRMDPIPANDSGIGIRREYFLVTERLDGGQLIEEEHPLSGPVRIGDKVRVKVSMTVSAGADVEHVNLEDRFPAGFEVVTEEPNRGFGWFWRWNPWWSAKEIHDDKVVFFATRVPWYHPTAGSGATYEYRYDLRAEVAGEFLALPAFAEAVYAPETHGRSAAVPFTVLD